MPDGLPMRSCSTVWLLISIGCASSSIERPAVVIHQPTDSTPPADYYRPVIAKDITGTDIRTGKDFAVPSGFLYHRLDQELLNVRVAQRIQCEDSLTVCTEKMSTQPSFFTSFEGVVAVGATALAIGAVGGILAYRYLE